MKCLCLFKYLGMFHSTWVNPTLMEFYHLCMNIILYDNYACHSAYLYCTLIYNVTTCACCIQTQQVTH